MRNAAAVLLLVACAPTAHGAAWLYPAGSLVPKIYVSRFWGDAYFDANGEKQLLPDSEIKTYDSLFLEVTLARPAGWNLYANIPYKTAYSANAKPNSTPVSEAAFGDLWMFGKRQLTGNPLIISAVPALKIPTSPLPPDVLAGKDKLYYGNGAWEVALSVPVALQATGSPLQIQAEGGLFVPLNNLRRGAPYPYPKAGAYGYAQAGAEAWIAIGPHQVTLRGGAETYRAIPGSDPNVCQWYFIKPYAGLKARVFNWCEAEVGAGYIASGRCAGTGTDVGFGLNRVF